MKVFRFMSKNEFDDYMKGLNLFNEKIHEGNTTSVGFCFLDSNDFEPRNAIKFLSGIVSMDYCVEFEVIKPLKERYGQYAKPIQNYQEIFNLLKQLGQRPRFTTKEYCTTFYNKDTLKVIRYADDVVEKWRQSFELNENPEFDWKEV